MMEKRRRSLAKAISWRITGTLDTILISYFLTQSLKIATSIGAIELVTKMGLYYIHERAWQGVNWGKKENPPSTSERAIS